MRTLLSLSLILISFYGQAQSIQKQVIGSLGGISSGGSYLVNCTVGEAVIDTFSSGSILLYQGYHHVTDSNRNTSLKETTALTINYLLYPNPTRGKATLKFTGASSPTRLEIQVYTLAGKLVSTEQVDIGNSSITTSNIDVGNESAGVYILRITDTQSNYSTSLRLVKQ